MLVSKLKTGGKDIIKNIHIEVLSLAPTLTRERADADISLTSMEGLRFQSWSEILRLPYLVLKRPAKLAEVLDLDPVKDADLAGRLSELAMTLLGEAKFSAARYKQQRIQIESPAEQVRRDSYRLLIDSEDVALSKLSVEMRAYLRYVSDELETGRFVDAGLFPDAAEALHIVRRLQVLRSALQ